MDPSSLATDAPQSPDSVFRYWAFISYSRHDTELAESLHSFLETYRIPRALVGRRVNGRTIPSRLLPVFRDRDDLASSESLNNALRDALHASWALIVVCSPQAAVSTWVNEEVRVFKAIGRSNRCFPLVVAGEPNASRNSAHTAAECLPPALRFEVDQAGSVTDRSVDPLAADARKGMDEWRDACLKIVAGILGVPFDELRRREEIRQRKRRLRLGMATIAAALAIGAGWVGLADADLSVLGGKAIREALDRFGLTVFRPVSDQAELARLAKSMRESLRHRLLADVASGAAERQRDAWIIGQVASAAFRDPEASPQELRRVLKLFHLLFHSEPGKREGYRLIERGGGDIGPRAEPALWDLLALSAALSRTDALNGDERKVLERYLHIAQRTSEAFYSKQDGGWNTGMRQLEPERHFTYTAALALHMLLETRAAKLGWRGSLERLDQMIANTANWLTSVYVGNAERPGWRTSPDDDRPPDNGVTLLVYSALGRACAQAEISVPTDLRDAALRFMGELRVRRYDSLDPDIRYEVRITDAAGAERTHVTVTRVLWFGWAVESVSNWRKCAEKGNLARERKVGLDRSLRHLLVDLGPEMVNDVLQPQRYLWVNAETYYGIGGAP